MLQQLTIRNFALLEEVRLSFQGGLNVLTGETGAGKSIIIDAIGTVLGGRASSEVIRTGADRATVEAHFQLPEDGDAGPVGRLLEEHGLLTDASAGSLSLAREISRTGRSVARVNGRVIPIATLTEIGGVLVDIHGQHEHLSLLRPGAQRDLLDQFGGLMTQRAEVAALVREIRSVQRELRSMQQDEREIARRIDLLSFQVEEIQATRLQPGEELQLEQERVRLANAGRLIELAAAAHEALAGGASIAGGASEGPSAVDLLGVAGRSLSQLLRIDGQLADQEALLIEATAQVEELAHALRRYQDAIEAAPDRLEQINERLDLVKTLQRKYGETVEEVLAFAETAGAELEGLVNREARTAELEQRTAALEAGIVAAASALSVTRGRAGASLAEAVGHEMRALGLKGALHVAVEQEESADGLPVDGERFRFDETGFDVVEFRFAPNPGEPARSVARTASGGELSRILLALKAVLSAADRTATLIFDEVDAGIGGRNGHVIGEKLAQIGGRHQVLCVTHLPQVAAFGDNHFYISKHVDGGRTVTTVVALDDAGRVRELAQMLGGVSTATAQQAQEMITTAEAWKRERGARGGFQVGESVVSTRTAAVAAPHGEKRARLRAKRAVSDRGLQKAPSPHETPTQPVLQGVS